MLVARQQQLLHVGRHALQVVAVAHGAQQVAHRAVLVRAVGGEHGEQLGVQPYAPAVGAEDAGGFLLEGAHEARLLLGAHLGLIRDASHEEQLLLVLPERRVLPALARGELHCVGATTLNEYRQYVEKDAALERRFQKVLADEPSEEDTIAILRGLKERYEAHHSVDRSDTETCGEHAVERGWRAPTLHAPVPAGSLTRLSWRTSPTTRRSTRTNFRARNARCRKLIFHYRPFQRSFLDARRGRLDRFRGLAVVFE